MAVNPTAVKMTLPVVGVRDTDQRNASLMELFSYPGSIR